MQLTKRCLPRTMSLYHCSPGKAKQITFSVDRVGKRSSFNLINTDASTDVMTPFPDPTNLTPSQ